MLDSKFKGGLARDCVRTWEEIHPIGFALFSKPCCSITGSLPSPYEHPSGEIAFLPALSCQLHITNVGEWSRNMISGVMKPRGQRKKKKERNTRDLSLRVRMPERVFYLFCMLDCL